MLTSPIKPLTGGRSPAIDYYRTKPHVVEALRSVVKTRQPKRIPVPKSYIPVAESDFAEFLKSDPELSAIDEQLTQFNLFQAINAQNQEIRHSNFIAWILTPSESHQFGDKFLKGFLRLVRAGLDNHKFPVWPDIDLSEVVIEREKKHNKQLNRIDLIITLPKSKLVVVVENKLHSEQRKGQLSSYRYAIDSAQDFKGYHKAFVLLSLKPEHPEDPQYISLTYSALSACLKQAAGWNTVYTPNQLKELFLRHYLNVLESSDTGCFNIFRALKADQKELRHSDVLAWLLSPEEAPDQSAAFLRGILRLLARKAPNCLKGIALNESFSDTEVHREFQDIDILLVSESRRLVIAIENKWNSREGQGQLGRYRKLIDAQFPDFSRLFVFLTAAGDEPRDPAYIPVSYREIVPLVKSLHKQLGGNRLPTIQEVQVFADQYFRLISEQLKAAVKAKIQLPDEIESACTRLIDGKPQFVAQLLIQVERWREDASRALGSFLSAVVDAEFGPDTFRDTVSVWLRFVPPEFDSVTILRNSSSDDDLQNKLAQYTFHIIPFGRDDVPYASNAAFEEDGILFTLGMARAKPGYEKLREIIYLEAKKRVDVFNSATTEVLRGARFSTLIKFTLVTGKEILRHYGSDLENLVVLRFQRFVRFQHKVVMKTFRLRSISGFRPRLR
jgi:hypothetical protein